MLTDKELQEAISKAFVYRKENLNARVLRTKIKTSTGKNVSLKRLMQILNENANFYVEIV